MAKKVKMSRSDVVRSVRTIERVDSILSHPYKKMQGGAIEIWLGQEAFNVFRIALLYFRNQVKSGNVPRMHLTEEFNHLSDTITDET